MRDKNNRIKQSPCFSRSVACFDTLVDVDPQRDQYTPYISVLATSASTCSISLVKCTALADLDQSALDKHEGCALEDRMMLGHAVAR